MKTQIAPTTHDQLIKMGWECIVDPPAATMGTGTRFYTLREMPKGLWSTAMLKKLTFKDACKVQGILNELADRHVNG